MLWSSILKPPIGWEVLSYDIWWFNPDTLDSVLRTRGEQNQLTYGDDHTRSSPSVSGRTLGRQHQTYGYRASDQSPMSDFSSPASFITASSPATYISARSTYNSPAYFSARGYSPAMMIGSIREEESPAPGLPAPIQQLHSDYYISLRDQNLIQPFDTELNWSGKGQHATFAPQEQIPLTVLSHLGSSNTTTVDKVLCRRIAVARKVMRCNRRWTVADALREVYHLQNLRHFHIVQLVGTYV
jgi:hypothetical protein